MICHSSASTQSATTEAASPAERNAQAAARGHYPLALGIWLRRTHTNHTRAYSLRAEEPAP